MRLRTPCNPGSHAPHQTAFVPAVPAVVNPPDVPSTVDPKQASAGDQRAPPPPRLLDALRDAIRVWHYSIRTEEAYVDWARRFVRCHGRRHPRELGAPELAAFLTHLAVDRTVAPSTQNQACSALMFLYCVVLQLELLAADNYVQRYPGKDRSGLTASLTRGQRSDTERSEGNVYA